MQTGLVSKYHNVTWAKDFQLEKLSICKMGLMDIVQKDKLISRGYRETGNVPLPGTPTSQPDPRVEGATWVRDKRSSSF